MSLISRRALVPPILFSAAGSRWRQRDTPPATIASAPFQQTCGFFGPDTTVSEAALREAVRRAAKVERARWFAAGRVVGMEDPQQFRHLVRYWLGRMSDIPPSTLPFVQAKAFDFTMNYGHLLDPLASDADVETWVALARDAHLAGAPGGGHPVDLPALVAAALRGAHWSITGAAPWSAVFVVACVRGAAIALGLERDRDGRHLGHDALLVPHEGHRVYVRAAHEHRLGPEPRDGTYHAFRPAERPVQVGDIVVVDRNIPETGALTDVVAFDAIPTAFLDAYPLHGDIVVAVTPSYVEAIGGNLCYRESIGGDPCALAPDVATCSVRRRRFPLNADGTLVVAGEHLFVQEDDFGALPALPLRCPAAGLHARSTGRVFALLSPIASCGR